MSPELFFARAVPAALRGGHLWPAYACAEAAEESAWGESKLAKYYNNLFGQKYPENPPPGFAYPRIKLATWEVVNGQRQELVAQQAPYWPVFPGWAVSFSERMALLRRLAGARGQDGSLLFPGYAAAIRAASGEEFVASVSRDWSTDPRRADNVLAIYRQHANLLENLVTQQQEILHGQPGIQLA